MQTADPEERYNLARNDLRNDVNGAAEGEIAGCRGDFIEYPSKGSLTKQVPQYGLKSKQVLN